MNATKAHGIMGDIKIIRHMSDCQYMSVVWRIVANTHVLNHSENYVVKELNPVLKLSVGKKYRCLEGHSGQV